MVDYTQEAIRKIGEIYESGAREYGFAQADRFHRQLLRKFAVADDIPTIGADYGNVRAGLRRTECHPFSIYYEQTAKGILIVDILHYRMDPVRHI